ncbi:MgtC/SapB family protein [Paenibacillus sp. GD4]|uniref:MgtC/SapB family protein n=1 Tax=Paenibacillus sp. GD4 TaxID=3068890 RepID=UPI002796CDBE|nr:MgtC/SapB family protein [Paenibacillus sp. GD4]
MMDPWTIDTLHITMRLIMAVALGGLIGFERETSSHAAGFRTHILVCLGSTLIMLLSMYGFSAFAYLDNVRLDPARLAAQVISGIGFLGAGTIMFTGKSITGLTTAASLWVVAAMGLAIGAGFYYAAAVTCLLAFMCLWGLNHVEKKYFRAKQARQLTLETLDRPGILTAVSSLLTTQGHDIRRVSVEETPVTDGPSRMTIHLTVRLAKNNKLTPAIDALKQQEGVFSVTCE